ncbi:hypothetical protein Acr_07g0009690 [Actinidia rufa]|uniref:CCHC-type domain-containing protein n=1 Tax=Actinidia rufa TaxID=165716 RepID=A0A7J0EWL8_9ERIC|nr:hypothetical protein Acr_07g0009690 [Actinidia rufa]
MAEHNLGSMIVLSATNYAIWKPGMEDILFCKDLHNPLENKGEKPIATKDEEWRKMNRKMIGLIRQCIGHEVFHHVALETSAYELWIKLVEMYQATTSWNKALLMRWLVNLKLQRETIVAEHTSEFQNLVNQLTSVDLQFDDEMQALLLLSSLLESWETLVVSLSNSASNGKLTTSMALVLEGSRERGRGQGRGHHRGTGKGRWRSQARDRTVRCFYCDQEGHIKRDCPKYKAQDQSSDTVATAVMVDDDESDVLLAASDDGKSDWGRIWMANNTSSRVVGRESVQFCMADGRDAALTLVEELSEFPRETRRCCGERRLEGYTYWRRMSRHEELLSDMGPEVLARRVDKGSNHCTEVRKASVGVPGGSEVVQERRKMLWDMYESLASAGSVRTREERWSNDNSQSDVLCSTPWWGVGGTPVGGVGVQGTLSYGRAGSEAVRKDNLKTSDYPPVGWRGRLLSPAYLDESKPTWMSPSPVAKLKPDWSSYGMSM